MGLFCKKNNEGDKPRKKMGCLGKTLIGLVIYFGLCAGIGWWYDNYGNSVSLEKNSVYKLRLHGVMVEQAPEADPFADALAEVYGQRNVEKVGLDELLSNIRLAKENDKVLGIYLSGGDLSMAPAGAKTLRDALLDFKQSGKWIVAYAENYDQLNYYVISVADKIYVNPVGGVDWNGLTAQKGYYTRVLQKLGVEMQILKVGTFKSAVEPFFRTSMSEADRHQTKTYMDGIWSEMRAAVSQSRGISEEELDRLANRYMTLQPQEEYVACGLVDSLVYIEGMDSVLQHLTGTEDYKLYSTAEMAAVTRKADKADDKIAIVYAEGEITDDSGDGIVGTKMIRTLKKVGKNKDVKAVVLRVNSPGGSANASEQIWYAVELLKQQGLPVVVSMGDYAASGGYYISSGADYIYAEPTTLTGSIGIFGIVPNVKGLREKIGYDIDGISTHDHSALEVNMIYRGMNDKEFAMMQTMVERGYDLFTRRCAAGRHTTQEAIKQIGEGRVWLGKDAMNIGLVDAMGNIDDAIAKAAELAELSEYAKVYYPQRKDFLTELMEKINKTTPEEKIVNKMREMITQPRILAIEHFPEIK